MRGESEGIDPETVERPGFLTKTTREYLLGEYDGTDAAKRTKRHEIKKRTRHAIADFALFNDYADDPLKKSVIRVDERTGVQEVLDGEMKNLDGLGWGILSILVGTPETPSGDSPSEFQEDLEELLKAFYVYAMEPESEPKFVDRFLSFLLDYGITDEHSITSSYRRTVRRGIRVD